MRNAAVLCAVALTLTSCCTFDRFLDKESALREGVPVGELLVARKDLVAMVVSVDYQPNKVDFVHITEEPGYVGREVLKRIRVPKGQVFEIVGARESSSLGCSRRYIVVRAKEAIEPSGAEVWLLEKAGGTQRVDPSNFELLSK